MMPKLYVNDEITLFDGILQFTTVNFVYNFFFNLIITIISKFFRNGMVAMAGGLQIHCVACIRLWFIDPCQAQQRRRSRAQIQHEGGSRVLQTVVMICRQNNKIFLFTDVDLIYVLCSLFFAYFDFPKCEFMQT